MLRDQGHTGDASVTPFDTQVGHDPFDDEFGTIDSSAFLTRAGCCN